MASIRDLRVSICNSNCSHCLHSAKANEKKLTEGLNIEKDLVTLESDIIMGNTSAVIKLIVKVPSVCCMTRLRNFLALIGKI